MKFRSIRHARLIAGTELRRSWRSITGKARWRLLLFAFAGLFFLIPIALAVLFSYEFAGQVSNGSLDAVSTFRSGAGAVTIFISVFVAVRISNGSSNVDPKDDLLTTVSYRDIIAGFMIAESGRILLVGALPLLAVSGGIAFGAESPLAFLTTLLALAELLVLGVVIAYPIGLGVRIVFINSGLPTWSKSAIGIGLMLAYLAVITTGSFNAVINPIVSTVGVTPFGWPADFALLGVLGTQTNLVQALGAPVFGAVVVVLLGTLATELAERLWYESASVGTEAAKQPTQESSTSIDTRPTETAKKGSALSARLLGRFVSRPVLRVAQKAWRRARRAPLKLWYAVYPLLLLLFQAGPILDSGGLPGWLVLYIAVVGAWASGAAFALNPLGDEGAVLPVTLTSSVSGARFIRGTVLAGTLVGIPVTMVLTAIAGVFSPLGPLEIVGAASVGAVLCVGSSALATGIGALYPKFEKSRITSSRKAVRPSFAAFIGYTIALVLVSLPGVIAQLPSVLSGVAVLGRFVLELAGAPAVLQTLPALLSNLAEFLQTTPETSVGGIVVTAAIASVAAWSSYQYAVRTIDGYTL